MIDDEDQATIEAIARRVFTEMAQQRGFRVEPELHYGQHKWIEGLIRRWDWAASVLGNAILLGAFAVIVAFLTWVARLKP